MTLVRIRHGFLTGAFALALGACSGANEPTSQPESTSKATTTAKTEENNVRQAGPDPSRFIKEFDRDGNGTVELSELPGRMERWLAKADKDNDGKLTADEIRAHAQEMKQEHFTRMDTNKDGALSAAEIGQDRWDHIKVADADNSGTITQGEIDQAFASGKLDFPKFGKRGHGKMFRMDANKDGALSADEVGEKKWSRISVADSNSDGRVTKDELKAAKESGKLAPMKREHDRERE